MTNKLMTSFTLFTALLIFSSPAFAGKLLCEYGQTITSLPYHYGNTPTFKTLVAPNILAYTQDCEGISCNIIFESFGYKNVVVEFNKARRLKFESLEGLLITCADARTDKIKSTAKRESKRLEDQAKRESKRIEDQTKRASKKAKKAARKVKKGLKGLFD